MTGSVASAASPTPAIAVPTLRFDAVHKRLRAGGEEVHILGGVDFTLSSGELVALVGPSGSGKSTILGLAAGLDSPTSGRVIIGDIDIGPLRERPLAQLRARSVGMVFQSYNLLPTLTALENVELPLLVPGARRPDPDRARGLLAELGLGHRLHHRPAQLSGGEQQRVAVARAMVTQPPLLIADEPTGNLDSATGDALVDILLGLRERYGTTVLVATHDDRLARRADRILRVRDGVLVDA